MSSAIPHIKSWIPYIGHGIPFSKNAGELLASMQAQHGDEFSMLLGGKKMTFIMDPHDYATVFKQAKLLNSYELVKEFGFEAFGIKYDNFNADSKDLHAQFDNTMQVKKLETLNQRTDHKLEQLINAQASEDWQDGELFHFVSKLMFKAAGEALYGDGVFDDDALFDEFIHYDKQFPLFLTGLPKWLFFRRSDRYLKNLYKLLGTPLPNQSDVFEKRFEFYNQIGTTEHDMGTMNAGLLWASQANTLISAFHFVFYVCKDEQLKKTLMQEVEEAFASSADNGPSVSVEALKKMQKVDAVIDEVLRLKSAVALGRQATADVKITLRSGRVLDLQAGENIMLYPRAMHSNPAIYENPEKFIWDRFLGKQKPNQFSYQGEPLKFNLLPFGAGVNICPGRHFARNEFKLLVVSLLNKVDIELIDTKEPEIDATRMTFSVLPPKEDVRFRYRLKK